MKLLKKSSCKINQKKATLFQRWLFYFCTRSYRDTPLLSANITCSTTLLVFHLPCSLLSFSPSPIFLISSSLWPLTLISPRTSELFKTETGDNVSVALGLKKHILRNMLRVFCNTRASNSLSPSSTTELNFRWKKNVIILMTFMQLRHAAEKIPYGSRNR